MLSRSSPFAPLVAALIALHGPASATPVPAPAVVHETWTFKDGAPQAAFAFAQTRDGYLWIGAESGLFRFDGVRFELFRSPYGDRLQSTNVSALYANADELWVGYRFGGFSRIRNGRVANFVEATGTVTSFGAEANGTVWAGTGGGRERGGLWRFDGTAWRNVGAEAGLPAVSVAEMGFDRDGTQWLLMGRRGIEMPKDLWFRRPAQARFEPAGESLVVEHFSRDADGYVRTGRERSTREPGSRLRLSLPAYPYLSSDSNHLVDGSHGLWLFSKQIVRFTLHAPDADAPIDRSGGESDPTPYNDGVHLVDREGSVWIGGETGVHRYSYSPLVVQPLPREPGPWFMLAPDAGGAVWIDGSNGIGNTALYRVVDGRIDTRRELPGASSFAYRAPDGSHWFGGEGGFWRMVDGHLTQIALPPELAGRSRFLVGMTHDGSGGFRVSFGGLGLYRMRDGAWTKHEPARAVPAEKARETCPTSGVVYPYTDAQGRVWLGCTRSQLAVLDANGERTYGPNEGIDIGNVTAIVARGDDIWIGGEFGLQHLDGARFRAVRALDPEALRGISGIVQTADGDLWLNGLGGIVHIRRAELDKALRDPRYELSVERFDRRAGLPGLPSQLRMMPTAVEGTDGRLWFSVTGGVVSLDPARASGGTPPPPVSIQAIAADDTGRDPASAPRLAPGTSSVQIAYAAVSLLHPEAVRFRYRLRGVDRDWRDASGATSVTFRNLPPGDYRFEVGVTDANGQWSAQTAQAPFTILPAFWQTAWFRALVVLGLGALLWAGYRLRVAQLQRRFEMTLDARVAERTRIARELHDTLLQSFHGLLPRLQTVFVLLPARAPEAKDQLGEVIEQAAGAIGEGRDAVQALRDSTTQRNDLALAIGVLGEQLSRDADAQRASAHLAMTVHGDPRDLHPIVRDEVYRIAAEALRNAFAHARAHRIDVDVRYDDDRFELRVHDDGTGIPAAVLRDGVEGHYGLRGMHERARVVGGTLSLHSEPRAGTEVELRVPAARAYARKRRWSWRRTAETA